MVFPANRHASSASSDNGVSYVLSNDGKTLLPVITESRRSHISGFSVFMVILGTIPGFLVVHALRTGNYLWNYASITRDETPLTFWIYVTLCSAACLGVISTAF